ncbi:MAG: hypothetical protein ACI8TP_002109 [Acidimicrobiales bacterium]|jgi:hypothetical protein
MPEIADLFSYADSPLDIEASVAESHRSVWSQLMRSGTWWTATEQLAIAARARAGFEARARPPWSRDLPQEVEGLPTAALVVIDALVANPSSIDASWAAERIADVGDGHYVELVSVVATVVMVDMFAACAGSQLAPLPIASSDPGVPSSIYPDGLGDIGAYVRLLDPFPYANVARALSLVPSANLLFRTTSVPMYSAPGMSDLIWTTPLTRPQVELVASRVAAMNECFY